MKLIHDGGPAFPVADISKTQCAGMTLRDYFAAAALQGIASTELSFGTAKDPFDPWSGVARDAYAAADAMLAARKGGAR